MIQIVEPNGKKQAKKARMLALVDAMEDEADMDGSAILFAAAAEELRDLIDPDGKNEKR